MGPSRCQSIVAVAAMVVLAGCSGEPVPGTPTPPGPSDPTPVASSSPAPISASLPTTGNVAALLEDPPQPMESVEINAYHGEGEELWMAGSYDSPSGCPDGQSSPLTDRPFRTVVAFYGHFTSNPMPDGAPYLIAAQLGASSIPELPRFARLRGHLGDPAFAHCREADRIFTVDEVVETYEEKRGTTYPGNTYERWQRYHDPMGRFHLAYPFDWSVTEASDDALTLRSERWPDGPVTVRTIDGTYDPTAVPGVEEPFYGGSLLRNQPPEDFVTSAVTPLWGDVHYCAGRLPDGCVEVVYSHGGNDFVLGHEYGSGFDLQQESLTLFQLIAQSFWIEGRATVTPTPPVNALLGDGPYWTREKAEEMALGMIPYGPWAVTDAQLVAEAEALQLNLCDMRRNDPDNSRYPYPDGVWIVELTGDFDGRDTLYYTYLDAETGHHLCTAEMGTREGPGTLPDARKD